MFLLTVTDLFAGFLLGTPLLHHLVSKDPDSDQNGEHEQCWAIRTSILRAIDSGSAAAAGDAGAEEAAELEEKKEEADLSVPSIALAALATAGGGGA